MTTATEKREPAASGTLTIPAPTIKTLVVRVVGDSSLICHAFSAKAKRQMLDKQMKKAKQAKPAKDPEAEFRASLYPIKGKPHTYGFKAGAFKEACIFACSHVEGITKVVAKGAFHMLGDFVEILDPQTGKPATPVMREDPVRIGFGTTDLRFRGEFTTWSCVLEIRYNANVITAEQIINLLNTAGFCSGVGEWRPSAPKKSGGFGMFHVKEAI